MAQKYVMACDLGTSGLKAVIVSIEGEVLASTTEPYALYTRHPLYAEQSPEEYWQAICRSFHTVRGDTYAAEDCAGIAFGTQWKGIIPVDNEGNAMRDCIIWMDKRAAAEAKEINEKLNFAERGLRLYAAADYWSKLYWLRKNEPEIYEKCAYILDTNGYLKMRATGNVVCDITNSYTRTLSPQRQAFYEEVLTACDIDMAKFPPICLSTDKVGGLTAVAAAELGLPEGTPVFGGCCDIPAMVIGSGRSELGGTHFYLGTSGWVAGVVPREPNETYRPPLDEKNDIEFLGIGVQVGRGTDWMLNLLYPEETKALGKGIFEFLNKELEGVPAGCDRLLATPWAYGARKPLASTSARAVFFNVNDKHTRAHMAKAYFEGICYMLRQNRERLYKAWPQELESITVCGGGAANPHWMQAMADIMHTDIIIPEDAQGRGAIGVACTALIGLGAVESYDTLKDHVRAAKVYHPRPENYAEYDLLYDQFKKLYGSLEEIFVTLNGPITG